MKRERRGVGGGGELVGIGMGDGGWGMGDGMRDWLDPRDDPQSVILTVKPSSQGFSLRSQRVPAIS